VTLARDLADWGLSLTAVMPAPVRHAAARHLLDGIGCALGAVRLGAAPSAKAWADLATEPATATALGLGVRRPTHVAAGVNGHLVHALDFDDTHAGGLVHATSVVLPAALAVGEEVGATGADVLTAAVVGYEVVCRLAAAAPHAFHRRGLHATSVCGVFAATLITCRLRGLDVDTTVNALGIAGSLASGSLEFLATGSDTKGLHPGLASANGVLAATLAAAGASGPDSVLEGEHGLYRVHAGIDVDPADVTADLGRTWQTQRITIKPYPACQLVHAALDATRAAIADTPVDPDTIAEVVVELPDDAVPIVAEPAATKLRPRSDYDAKFSLPWTVATVLVDGDLTIDAFADRDRPQVLALADRVRHVAVNPGVVAADAPGRVRLTLDDGTHLDGHVPASRGGPAMPLSDADLIAKFTATSGTDAGVARIILALDDLDDVAVLTDHPTVSEEYR
jgi:2-methylcitrate dehydratase PrpD